jgi:ATP-dependent RNA helicase RhlE
VFGLSAPLLQGVAEAGFSQPRPIQVQAIPAALEGRDVLGLAQTGTGKTAAFALPLLERLLAKAGRGPRALVLAPTRELAAQIAAEIRTLARFTPVETITLFGGVPAGPQRAALRREPQILVACPGRLLDLLGQGILQLDRIEMLVLDEADHMFDMGFLPDIRRILAALPRRRQNLLFSATMPAEVRRLADGLLSQPLVVELAHSRPAATVSHVAYSVDSGRKIELLEQILADRELVSAIVFTRTKHRARRLARDLDRSGRRVVALQGNMTQAQRVNAMEGFRRRQFEVLVATDIAARGLDVEQVSHVVNFDMPDTADAYTHRIGRTGRAERTGKAVSFVTPDDWEVVQAIERRMGTPLPWQAVEGITQLTGLPGGAPAAKRPVVRSFRPRHRGTRTTMRRSASALEG